ncbi:phage portal protein [Methylobacterium sp. BTF04]|uniref:phage portal protein n=1 Tax=Methylobacterium sp. BTF04 TaxID=2708300 RepID=UPI0013D4CE2E|nr:phage portal protein [Methylobacterium sp. BTF04]NEU14586.1 phage portal protein [Methylobacterium sp. BTF04]
MALFSRKKSKTDISNVETKAALVPSSVSAPEDWFVELAAGRATSAGVRVGAYNAMTVPAVKRAVDLIGSTVGILPVRVFTVAADDARSPAPDHPAFSIVHRTANPWTSARKFRETLTRDALLHGNGYAALVRVGGKPRELIHLPPGTVSVDLDQITREPFYRATLDGESRVFTFRDMLHVAAPSLDGTSGASPVRLGREAIGLALTLEAPAARLFGNGARPGGVLRFPTKLGQDAANRMKRAWQAAFGGEGSGGTAVIEEGGDFTSVTLTSVDAQFLEMRQQQTREIACVFGVPATMLNDLSSATFSNTEALGQAFRDETVMPWVVAWETAYERVLLDEGELTTYAIVFDLDGLDRADLSSKTDAIAKRRAAGIVTANEERRALNLPAHANGNDLGSPYTTANAGQPAKDQAA